jgi:hypothetical protein
LNLRSLGYDEDNGSLGSARASKLCKSSQPPLSGPSRPRGSVALVSDCLVSDWVSQRGCLQHQVCRMKAPRSEAPLSVCSKCAPDAQAVPGGGHRCPHGGELALVSHSGAIEPGSSTRNPAHTCGDCGGRYWDRTSDLFRVKRPLGRLFQRVCLAHLQRWVSQSLGEFASVCRGCHSVCHASACYLLPKVFDLEPTIRLLLEPERIAGAAAGWTPTIKYWTRSG